MALFLGVRAGGLGAAVLPHLDWKSAVLGQKIWYVWIKLALKFRGKCCRVSPSPPLPSPTSIGTSRALSYAGSGDLCNMAVMIMYLSQRSRKGKARLFIRWWFSILKQFASLHQFYFYRRVILPGRGGCGGLLENVLEQITTWKVYGAILGLHH